jgi:hypothetical protein
VKRTAQGIRDLNGPPRNGRTRSSVVAPPAKATRCQHVFGLVKDGEFGDLYYACEICDKPRGELTGRGFR